MSEATVFTRGFQFLVDYDYSPACRGAREKGTGVPLEPDEAESCTINEIHTDEDLVEVFQSFKNIEELREELETTLLELGDER